MRIVKKGNTVESLLKSMRGKVSVKVGHFKDQGKHSSGYTYPELMAFHHKDSDFDNKHVPPRPILDITRFIVDESTKQVFKGVEDVFKGSFNKASVETYMKKVGERIKDIEQDIFGSSPPLTSNSEVTQLLKGRDEPMVETGELRDKVEVRLKSK